MPPPLILHSRFFTLQRPGSGKVRSQNEECRNEARETAALRFLHSAFGVSLTGFAPVISCMTLTSLKRYVRIGGEWRQLLDSGTPTEQEKLSAALQAEGAETPVPSANGK